MGKKHSGILLLTFWLRLLWILSNAKLTIGPAIENGFYYDVDFGEDFL
jgi:threonyl-tRNA synthetase